MGMSRITLPFPLFLAGGVALFAAGINVCLLALAFTGAHPGTSARAARACGRRAGRVRTACAGVRHVHPDRDWAARGQGD